MGGSSARLREILPDAADGQILYRGIASDPIFYYSEVVGDLLTLMGAIIRAHHVISRAHQLITIYPVGFRLRTVSGALRGSGCEGECEVFVESSYLLCD
jgi:hypothetical protein